MGRTATQSSAARGFSGQDGAIAWSEFSPFPWEAGIAGRRYAIYAGRMPNEALWYAVAEAALEGHHAAGALIEPYLRARCARIGEVLRDIEKADDVDPATRSGGLRSIASVMAEAVVAAARRGSAS